jgi:GntR family transcriptional regulator
MTSVERRDMSEWITSSQPYLSPRAADAPDPWKHEAAQAGHVGAHRVILVDRQIPPSAVSALLSIEDTAPAILRRRLVTLDGVPVEIADSWYPAHLADGTSLASSRPIKGGALRALADLGYVATRHVETIAVIDTPEQHRDLLSDPVVIELTRTSYTPNDTPFEVAVMLMSREMAPGVARRLQYELRTA